MKKLILIALIFVSCSGESPKPKSQVVTTDPAIQVFVNEFKDYTTANKVSFQDAGVLVFGSCDCKKDGYWQVNSSADDISLEFFVLHAMGHAALGRKDTTSTSIMNVSSVGLFASKRDLMMQELISAN